jgi:hypothetical protein
MTCVYEAGFDPAGDLYVTDRMQGSSVGVVALLLANEQFGR